MTRSTSRTGLAAAAVAALAVSGLALTAPPASAADPEVVLLSQLTPDPRASTRYDGEDSLIRLTAVQVDEASTISFEWNADPAADESTPDWTAITGTSRIVGTGAGSVHTVTWDGSGAVGSTVAVRAVATASGVSTTSTRNDVVVTDSGTPSVQIGPSYVGFPVPDGDFADTGYFAQPYADAGLTATTLTVHGTTSATSGTVPVSWWDGSAFTGTTDAAVSEAILKAPNPGGGNPLQYTGGSFVTVLDIDAFEPTDGAVLTLAARLESDDVLPTVLREQTITGVTAYPNGAPVEQGQSGGVTVQVTDAEGQGIAGAEVRTQETGALVGYTDGYGYLGTSQLGDTTETYYANATDADGYDAEDGDVASDPVLVRTVPRPSHAVGISGDGALFDVDEHGDGDVYVQVLDQYEDAIASPAEVWYRLYPEGTTPPATYTTATADADGRVAVPFDAQAGSFVLEAGLATEDPADFTTTFFSAGDAQLGLTPVGRAVGRIGGQVDYVGRLAIDGAPLAGRRVTLTFRRGVEVVPGSQPDAGILVDGERVLSTDVVTDGDGEFQVRIDDVERTPRASEIGGRLVAVTADQTAEAPDAFDGDALERATVTTRFGTGRRSGVRVLLGGDDNGARDDVLRVTAPTSAAGELVRLYRTAPGGRTLVATRRLDGAGDLPRVVVADRNGRTTSTYRVQVVPSRRVVASSSAAREVR